MMRLSTMRKVIDTLGEDRACPVAAEILQRWGYDPGSVQFLRASANFICTFRREGRPLFLRFNEASARPAGAVEAEVKLVDRLRKEGIKVAAPVPSRQRTTGGNG